MAFSNDPEIPPIDEHEREIRRVFDLDVLPGTLCFYCGEAVEHPAIYWHGLIGGDGVNLWLHKACVIGLFIGLLQDHERMTELETLRDRFNRGAAA